MEVRCQTWWWQACLQLQRVHVGGWWSWNDGWMPLETHMGTYWSNLPLLDAFFPNGLERSQHLFLPKVWEGPRGGAVSWLEGCSTRYMSGTIWCSRWCLLPCQASKHMFWPGPLPYWCRCGFHGGPPLYCLCRMVEWPLIHPWWGGHHRWRAHLGSSSRIWPLWGHDLVCQAKPFRVSQCTIERMGSHCISAAILWDISGRMWRLIWHQLIGLTWSWCWFWMEDSWGHLPEACPCLVGMLWSGHTAADGGAFSGVMQGLLFIFRLIILGACGLFPWWMSSHTGM